MAPFTPVASAVRVVSPAAVPAVSQTASNRLAAGSLSASPTGSVTASVAAASSPSTTTVIVTSPSTT